MTPAFSEALASLEPVQRGDTYMARCPTHDDRVRSLSIKDVGDKVLLTCHAGCAVPDIVRDLGIAMTDLFEPDSEPGDRKIAQAYAYQNADGTLAYQVLRYEPKGFAQRRPDGAGGWIYDLEGTDRVPYRLPGVIRANEIYVVEGEKDADRLAGLGLAATCNAGGAGKWRSDWGPYFTGKSVVIIPDNDDPGRKHALDVQASVLAHAKRVRIVDLPGLPPKGDVSDYLAEHSGDELLALLRPPVAPTIHQFIDTTNRAVRDDLFESVIPSGALVVFVGQPRSFKTMAALQMMFAVASGQRWLGREPQRTGGCLYVSEEGSRDKVAERLAAMDRVYGSVRPIHILHREGVTLTGTGWSRVRDTLDEMDDPAVVILDTLAALMEGDENSVSDVRDALRPVQQLITDYGVTVILVHHVNKTGEGRMGNRMRGSSALWGACDGTLGFVRDEDDNGVGLDGGEVRIETKDNDPSRIRFGFHYETMTLKADARPALTVTSLIDEVARRQAEAQGSVSIEDIRTYFQVGKSWFYELVKRAEEAGLERTDKGHYRVREGMFT